MGTNFRNEYPVEGKDLKIGLKVWMNNAWWKITSLELTERNSIIVEVEAKFKGSAKVELELDKTYYVDSAITMGHKHEHILTNDSSTPNGKKFKYPYDVVNTPYGMGNERGN